jgi:capsular exopolysaccharide synthesis family protein
MDTANTDTPVVNLHFLDYWRVIRLRKSLILTVFLICVITSSVLTYCLPKQYSSTVRIEVNKSESAVNILGTGASSQNWDPYYLTTQFRIITSWGILYQVITNMNLQEVFAQAEQAGEPPWTPDRAYAYLYRKVSVEQTRGTSLIEITVKYPDPNEAARIANTIVDFYKKYRMESWVDPHARGIESLQEALSNNQAVLLEKKNQLNVLTTNLDIAAMGVSLDEIVTLSRQTRSDLEIRRMKAEADYQEHYQSLTNLLYLQSKGLLEGAMATAIAGGLDPELTIRVEAVVRARDQYTQASGVGFGPDNPTLIAAQKALQEATNAYEAKIAGIMTGLESRVNQDSNLLQFIVKEEADTKASAQLEAITNSVYLNLKREVDNVQRVVDDLNRRLIEQRVELVPLNERAVFVHDPARPNKNYISPKPLLIIPVGILLGLLVGVGMAFFVEYLDTSVKTIDDVERSLQAPVLGVIPQNVGNVLDDGPESPHAEAYRVLRTNLLFARKNEDWTTLTVLSGGAGEGKTTTLFNLATVFAQSGQRVLIVDSDLRRPSIHRMLRVSNATGLTDLLLNKQATVDQVIQKTKLPTLDFLPSGKLPSSSMSILGSIQMKDVVAELKGRYDFVFFDSPPLMGVSDASVLASEIEMVLQVIQYRRYPMPMTLRAKQMISKVGGTLMGLVLNNINMSQDENYYYYSGYYEYEYRSSQSEPTVVQLSDAAAKTPKIDIKQKY